jgi:hypothetical protein
MAYSHPISRTARDEYMAYILEAPRFRAHKVYKASSVINYDAL